MEKKTIMGRGSILLVGVIVVLSFGTAACGDSDDGAAAPEAVSSGAESTANDVSESESPDPGTGSESGGDSAELGDFPIPAPPGGDVSSVQSPTSRLTTYPASERDSIVEFYEEWIADGDWAAVEGLVPGMTTIGDQFSATPAVSETEVYQVVSTPSGDSIDVALVILG